MTLTVYGSPLSPFVRKVRAFLAEKGLAYTLDPVNVFAPPPSFLEISPLKRIPVLRDDSEGPDATLPDSSVICAYLERKHPSPALYPTKPFAYGRALWLEEYADSELVGAAGAGIFRPIVVNMFMRKEPDHALANATWEQKMPRFLDYLDKQIEGRSYFVGDALTIADIAVASPFANLAHAGFAPADASHPNLTRFLKTMLARPSFAESITEERKILAPLGLKHAS